MVLTFQIIASFRNSIRRGLGSGLILLTYVLHLCKKLKCNKRLDFISDYISTSIMSLLYCRISWPQIFHRVAAKYTFFNLSFFRIPTAACVNPRSKFYSGAQLLCVDDRARA